ncbi:hypothetical protein [Corynebacterium kefirresidentii]|uniref:hypothetical protein n=1 Tax=Corynebacterium kefirresidentii TaxID=1979527 RepID=UPI0038D0542A
MTGNDFINKVLKDFQNKTGMTSEELNQQMKIALHRIVNNREEVMANFSKMLESAMPQGPTMEEIEWEDGEHFLTEAVGPAQSRNVMLEKEPETDLITVAAKSGNEWNIKHLPPKWLAPTGRKYELKEIERNQQ